MAIWQVRRDLLWSRGCWLGRGAVRLLSASIQRIVQLFRGCAGCNILLTIWRPGVQLRQRLVLGGLCRVFVCTCISTERCTSWGLGIWTLIAGQEVKKGSTLLVLCEGRRGWRLG